jgi:hypothetical protein
MMREDRASGGTDYATSARRRDPDLSRLIPAAYTMKKFAELLRADGIEVNHKDSLHGRAGRYINTLRRAGQIGEISDQIAKSATQIFERFNDVRNNSSLAHDNQLLGRAEGRYVFETILSLLRFIKALDEAKFGS